MDYSEINKIHYDGLECMEANVEAEIQLDGFGAINAHTDQEEAPEGIYLIQWKSEAYPLQEPTIVEGCSPDDPMPPGTMVAKGIYWTRVQQNPNWYEPQKMPGAKVITV